MRQLAFLDAQGEGAYTKISARCLIVNLQIKREMLFRH
jgi:hypothetical protein